MENCAMAMRIPSHASAFAIEFIRHEQDEYERQYRYLRSIHLESVEHPRPLEGRKEDDGKESVYAERKRFFLAP